MWYASRYEKDELELPLGFGSWNFLRHWIGRSGFWCCGNSYFDSFQILTSFVSLMYRVPIPKVTRAIPMG